MKKKYKSNDLGKIIINLNSLESNYKIINRKIGDKSSIAAVLKSDAYGLGVNKIAQTLSKAGCDKFFVATLNEALKLRKIIQKDKIFILNGIISQNKNMLRKILSKKFIPVLNSINEIKRWVSFLESEKVKAPSILHFDTGMNRLGISFSELDEVLKILKEKKLKIFCIMTHLASADEKNNRTNDDQKKLFNSLKKKFPNTQFSIANSNAIFNLENFNFSFVRAGGALFGINPIQGITPIKNVVSLFAKIIQVRDIDEEPSRMVGYNSTYRIKSSMKIGVLGVGYADGYPRNLSNFGYAIYDNIKLPIIGRISMDYITVDLSNIKNHQLILGKWVELIGNNISIEELSNLSETIPYELLNNLGYRLKKKYINQ